ncbi:TetR/AcrR family transcriptional regulator [Lysobacter sp. S4-A87]|uniref:TetR/AcrR family transcriptional regulator n=1 Tax=Lysobacter sp. S4-A87 TaxID=2925843 RepID=UPI001F533280|nr:TetR/AcrR family transcriptional regulator [Lysobacter sp. S4-A87]UNK48705.1 TetR/AcrR family transcriptional regulator [Lysobacter sp. S4-A87]
MPKEASRRTRRSSNELRDQILDAACELFLRDGYATTSIDAVIEKVGGSKRAIYSHFGGKEDLFAAIMTNLSEEALEALPDAEDSAGDDVRESLLMFARAIMRILMDPRTVALYRLIIAEGTRMPGLAQAFLDNGPRRATSGLAQLLKRHRDAGLLDIPRPTEAAEHFVGMLRDDVYLEVVLGVRPPLAERVWKARVTQVVDIFLDGTRA